MKRRVFTKFAAICMAAVMLCSDAGAVMAADTATDEVELAADEQSVSFTAEYAEIGVPLSVDVTGMTGNLKYDWEVNLSELKRLTLRRRMILKSLLL